VDLDDIAVRLREFRDAEDHTDDVRWQRALIEDIYVAAPLLPGEMQQFAADALWFLAGFDSVPIDARLRAALTVLAESENEGAAVTSLALLLFEFDDGRGIARLRRAIGDAANPGSADAATALTKAAKRGNRDAAAAVRHALGSTAIDGVVYDALIHQLTEISPNPDADPADE
jgi:hypothetical protein